MNLDSSPIIAVNRKGDHINSMRTALAIPILFLASVASPAHSASSEWIEAQGARVRLVTSGLPDRLGEVTGALQIELRPGWKTYWRDPGEVGVPPNVDIEASSNLAAASLSFPAPQRIQDGDFSWAGYRHSVALPIRLTLKRPTDPVSANVFLGICEAICIPVQGSLAVDPANDPENADDASVVAAALARLPAPEKPDFGVTIVESSTERIVVEANFAGGPDAVEFFIAGEDGYTLGTPTRMSENGRTRFAVALLDRPASRPSQGGLPYTLVTAAGAVEGLLPYP